MARSGSGSNALVLSDEHELQVQVRGRRCPQTCCILRVLQLGWHSCRASAVAAHTCVGRCYSCIGLPALRQEQARPACAGGDLGDQRLQIGARAQWGEWAAAATLAGPNARAADRACASWWVARFWRPHTLALHAARAFLQEVYNFRDLSQLFADLEEQTKELVNTVRRRRPWAVFACMHAEWAVRTHGQTAGPRSFMPVWLLAGNPKCVPYERAADQDPAQPGAVDGPGAPGGDRKSVV